MYPALNLTDYAMSAADQEVFHGGGSSDELGQLSKALEAGLITGRDTTNQLNASGSPLKVESLERTLKVVTFQDKQIVSWKLFPKDKAFNTVEEFNQQTSYGSEENSAFLIEGELPGEEDSQYVRRAKLVKFMGVTRSVSHVMTLVNTNVGNVIDQEARSGTLSILQRLNRSLFFADSRLNPQSFDGLYAQHESHDGINYVGGSLANYLASELVVDMRGKVLTPEKVELAMEAIAENYGVGTHLFGPPKVFSNYANQMTQFQRYNLNADNNGLMPGNNIPGQVTNFGNVDFVRDVFLRRRNTVEVGVNSGATNAKAPGAIVPDGSTPQALVGSDSESKFVTADAGNYVWGVRAVNRFGSSALVVLSNTPLSIVAGSSAALKWAAASSGETATHFEVFRSQVGSITKFDYVFSISAAQLAAGYDGGSAGVVRDRNRFMPATDQAFLVENKQEVLTYKQLAPLMKMDLAVVSPSYRFMILQYGTPMFFAPRKAVRFINIGTITT